MSIWEKYVSWIHGWIYTAQVYKLWNGSSLWSIKTCMLKAHGMPFIWWHRTLLSWWNIHRIRNSIHCQVSFIYMHISIWMQDIWSCVQGQMESMHVSKKIEIKLPHMAVLRRKLSHQDSTRKGKSIDVPTLKANEPPNQTQWKNRSIMIVLELNCNNLARTKFIWFYHFLGTQRS